MSQSHSSHPGGSHHEDGHGPEHGQDHDAAPRRRTSLFVLLACLGLTIGAYAYDRQVALKGSQAGFDRLMAEVDRSHSTPLNSPEQVTSEDVVKAIGFRPMSEEKREAYTVQTFGWRRGVPFMTYKVYAYYFYYDAPGEGSNDSDAGEANDEGNSDETALEASEENEPAGDGGKEGVGGERVMFLQFASHLKEENPLFGRTVLIPAGELDGEMRNPSGVTTPPGTPAPGAPGGPAGATPDGEGVPAEGSSGQSRPPLEDEGLNDPAPNEAPQRPSADASDEAP